LKTISSKQVTNLYNTTAKRVKVVVTRNTLQLADNSFVFRFS